MKYLWWKNKIILENVIGYTGIHVVDITVLARNGAQWNSAKLWILYDLENKKTKGSPLIILQWAIEWVYFIKKHLNSGC